MILHSWQMHDMESFQIDSIKRNWLNRHSPRIDDSEVGDLHVPTFDHRVNTTQMTPRIIPDGITLDITGA